MLIVRFRETFRERATEWVVSTVLAGWGFTVMQSPGLFDRPFYAPLAAVGNEQSWGWLAFLIGMARLTFLFINGAWHRTPMLRQLGCAVGMIVWVMLAMGSLSVGWRSPSIATYLGLFFLDALSLSFAARDGALVSARHGVAHGSD